jgi:hypothetical protein
MQITVRSEFFRVVPNSGHFHSAGLSIIRSLRGRAAEAARTRRGPGLRGLAIDDELILEACTGRSAGFLPFRTRLTQVAAPRCCSTVSKPYEIRPPFSRLRQLARPINPRVRSLAASGRRPGCPSQHLAWPASETLHTSGPKEHHSKTSSARPDSGSGMVMPSARAVLKLMYISTLVACCTGRSAGLSPLRIRPA